MEKKKINPIAEQSQEMITSALFELLKERSYSQITISDIAERALLARRTFYRNFTSKEDILKKYYIHQSEQFKESLEKEDDLSVYIVAKRYFTFMEKNMDILKLLDENNLLYLILQFSQPVIYEFFKSKTTYSDKEEYLNFLFAFISGGYWNLLVIWIKEGAVRTPEEMAVFISTILNKDLYTFN